MIQFLVLVGFNIWLKGADLKKIYFSMYNEYAIKLKPKNFP